MSLFIEKETDKTVYDFITDDKAMNFVFDYGKTYIAREVETVEGYYKNDKDIEFIATPNLTVDNFAVLLPMLLITWHFSQIPQILCL
mgnify:FL=1